MEPPKVKPPEDSDEFTWEDLIAQDIEEDIDQDAGASWVSLLDGVMAVDDHWGISDEEEWERWNRHEYERIQQRELRGEFDEYWSEKMRNSNKGI